MSQLDPNYRLQKLNLLYDEKQKIENDIITLESTKTQFVRKINEIDFIIKEAVNRLEKLSKDIKDLEEFLECKTNLT